MNPLASEILRLRDLRGLTQKQLSRIANFPRVFLDKMEAGVDIMPEEKMKEVIRILSSDDFSADNYRKKDEDADEGVLISVSRDGRLRIPKELWGELDLGKGVTTIELDDLGNRVLMRGSFPYRFWEAQRNLAKTLFGKEVNEVHA